LSNEELFRLFFFIFFFEALETFFRLFLLKTSLVIQVYSVCTDHKGESLKTQRKAKSSPNNLKFLKKYDKLIFERTAQESRKKNPNEPP
jgi:hypothetical protein